MPYRMFISTKVKEKASYEGTTCKEEYNEEQQFDMRKVHNIKKQI